MTSSAAPTSRTETLRAQASAVVADLADAVERRDCAALMALDDEVRTLAAALVDAASHSDAARESAEIGVRALHEGYRRTLTVLEQARVDTRTELGVVARGKLGVGSYLRHESAALRAETG
jgi:hypothetical protein